MLVPKLFRLLFFRKSNIDTVFDAIRDEQSIYVDTSIHVTPNQETWKNNISLSPDQVETFINTNDKEKRYILFGNNKMRLDNIQRRLEEAGFTKVYNAGGLENLKEIEGI